MNHIGPKRYRLLFYGNVLAEADPAQARQALAQRYRLSDKKLTVCFSGHKVALHSELNEHDAYRIQSELEDAGLITHLELLATPPSSVADQQRSPTPEPLAITTQTEISPIRQASSPSAASAMKQRGRQQPENTAICAHCKENISPRAMHCRFCGAAIGTRKLTWLWLTLPALALAIIAVVAIQLSLPMYQQQQTRQHLAEGIKQAESVSEELQAFIDRTDFWPNSNLDASLPEPDRYANASISHITVGNKALITVTFNPSLADIGGDTLVFIPQRDIHGKISWRCEAGTLDPALLPTQCLPPNADAYQPREQHAPLELPTGLPVLAPTPATGPSKSKIQRLIREEIEQTHHVRQAMTQTMIADGVWPQSNAIASLPAARLIGSAPFRKVQVQPEGRILYEFSDIFPQLEGHKLWLVPTSIGNWRCESTLPDEYIPASCGARLR